MNLQLVSLQSLTSPCSEISASLASCYPFLRGTVGILARCMPQASGLSFVFIKILANLCASLQAFFPGKSERGKQKPIVVFPELILVRRRVGGDAISIEVTGCGSNFSSSFFRPPKLSQDSFLCSTGCASSGFSTTKLDDFQNW